MSGLLKTIDSGIQSATYNKDAEVAKEVAVVKAKTAKENLRAKLFSLRDLKLEMQKENKASGYYSAQLTNIVDNGFKYLTDNPNAKVDEIKEKQDSIELSVAELERANAIVQKLDFLRNYIPSMADADLANKQISSSQKKQLDEYAAEIGKYADYVNSSPLKYSTQDIFKKEDQFTTAGRLLQSEIYQNKKDILRDTTQKEIEQLKKSAETAKKAEASKFNSGRMVKTTLGVAGTTVAALLLLVLILIGGMLASNDVIGRPVGYRILYFIYGGIFFPFVLPYYLYRWFKGTAPNIYRLLPIFKNQAESSMGRFFLYPFTYNEDKSAIDAHINFMKQAASIVGKKYSALSDADVALGKVTESIKDLTVQGTVAVAAVGAKVAETVKETPTKVSEEAGRILKALSNIDVKPKS